MLLTVSKLRRCKTVHRPKAHLKASQTDSLAIKPYYQYLSDSYIYL